MGIGGTITLPITICIGIYFMWSAVGTSFLSGLGILIIASIVNCFISSKYLKYKFFASEIYNL